MKLNNNTQIPIIGLGCYSLQNPEETVQQAIQIGYRLLDSAKYYNNDVYLGKGINKCIKKGDVKREDLYILTKVWNDTQQNVQQQIEQSLIDLQIDYLDCVLIHWPFGKSNQNQDIINQVPLHILWKQLENMVNCNKVKSIGVSNFNCQLLMDLLSYCNIKPVINQIECHPSLIQKDLIDFCQRFGIQIMSYCPLRKGGSTSQIKDEKFKNHIDIFDEPIIKQLSKKYNKLPSQIILNWHLQRKIIPIPKSNNNQRLLQNYQSAHFQLENQDVELINQLNCDLRIVNPKWSMGQKMKGFPVFS